MNISVQDKLFSLITPVVEENNMELVDIEYRNEAGGMVLRVYIDKSGGVTIDDCSTISRELSTILDVDDTIDSSYTLEVSSPGLRRPLKKVNDFNRFKEKTVKIKTKELIENRKNFLGVLKGINNQLVVVDIDGKEYHVPFDSIVKANLELDF